MKSLTYRQFEKKITEHYSESDLKLIRKAYDFANEAHAGQKRATGVDYIEHSLNTAYNLADLRLPTSIIMAGLLHDVPEDTERTLDEIKKEFGADISKMVEGITKLSNIKYRGIERYVENLRKMFVAMAEDIRVILIKFADRLHNLETLYALPANKQKRIALETLEIYTPIANRLGIGDLQAKLEDAAFKYAYTEKYTFIEQLIKQTIPKKKEALNKMIKAIKANLDSKNIPYNQIYGRTKHYYSFYRKYLKFNSNAKNIYDLIAMRIIVDSVTDCYTILGIIHNHYKPIRGKIKDYIAQPKPNGYQSLHTAVFGENNEIIEIQIRTREMNEQAEYGIAAHWHYKETKSNNREISWVNELASWLKNISDNDKFLEGAKIDIFKNRIFVFTPNGDVIDLPEEASPVDFAYHIHTDIGNKCTQALVNSELVPLKHKLQNGDVVEIITDKNKKGPTPDWLDFVKT
ncbi:bifunctional (p)ppGpp synthetase/guanosine-3',5'-bis(diphosphate) 3'-pyrophosphohydrolase, partial [Candidatus Falkowbacteria bacterium]|nr:bifunctional (p)ppGpp synthetase/guanosine-3',5'-bis(diphosphate) 3'-pyrophosphohydrolase [Candidatus Falkowbacteria bacterium]